MMVSSAKIEAFFQEASRKGALSKEEFEGLKYYRLKDDTRRFLRGTVYVSGEIILGYPKIPRILTLESGLKRHLRKSFWMEEKADGYNVRVTKIGDKIVAFTRGGYICPFTTDRLNDLGDFKSFFEEHPDLVIGGEVVGQESPYAEVYPDYLQEPLAFLAFDIFKKNDWRFLSPPMRYKLLSDFRINQVKSWGPFTTKDIDNIKQILRDLDSQICEGVVIKTQSNKRFKYVLPKINIRDIEFSSFQLLELPAEFFVQRILRLVLASKELGIPIDTKQFCQLGEAFIKGLSQAIDNFKVSGSISKILTLRFRTRERIDTFLKQVNSISRVVRIRALDIRPKDGFWEARLEKKFLVSSKKLKGILSGNIYYD